MIKKIKNREFEFFKAQVENEEFIISYFELFESCFGKREDLNREWYNWFNLASPFGKNDIFLVKDLESNQLVSAYGLLPYQVNYNQKLYPAALCTNVMVHPDYRGYGLFVETGLFALKDSSKKGNKIVIGIPNENAIRGHLKVGWNQLDNLYFLNINPSLCEDKPLESGIKELTNYKQLENISSFFEKYNYSIVRNKEFIKWRFLERPNKSYKIFILEEYEKVEGYIVLKKFLDEEQSILKTHIVDFGYNQIHHLKKLLNTSIYYSKQEKSHLLNMWHLTEESTEYNCIVSIGFRKTENFNYFINYSDQINYDNIHNWHITLGDNDVY
ncbi:GNAT family N-acetyltransferase [Bernardetia sp. MNP-M8]|uniref:GNAT family N-acetyltransferase n=1 Tax=Bernardetia sp. MNP-M8 TaxID=3127470 RepID=UPI0030D08F54